MATLLIRGGRLVVVTFYHFLLVQWYQHGRRQQQHFILALVSGILVVLVLEVQLRVQIVCDITEGKSIMYVALLDLAIVHLNHLGRKIAVFLNHVRALINT